MADICGDNRFQIIDEFKKKLLKYTNIESSPQEMAVLDDILFRFWQMGWLDKIKSSKAPEEKIAMFGMKLVAVEDGEGKCSHCALYGICEGTFCRLEDDSSIPCPCMGLQGKEDRHFELVEDK